MNRSKFINDIRSDKGKIWDIIIIGGGATGLGICLDAASRGYSTLLLEQSDFAKSTSSRSTKLVHGGVRYMAQGDLLLVMEALHERGIMLRNAPHLTFNQDFVIPVYTYFDAFLYTVGLKFYDLLAGRLSMGRSYFIGKEKAQKRLPLLKSQGLKGGIVYHDGQFDDSRMAFALASKASQLGATPINYIGVTGLKKNEHGRITGVEAADMLTGEKFDFLSRSVINATGVFADDVARLDTPGMASTIRPSQGVHIVLDKSFLQSDSAIMIPKTSDGRVLFAIPWYGKVVVGTTDTPVDNVTLEPIALEKEIDFILETASGYMTKQPTKSDIQCVFAGLRPLAAAQGNSGATREVSRRHKISVSKSGLVTIIGGKWTTYRAMAEETVDATVKASGLKTSKCNTKSLRLTSKGCTGTKDHLHIYGDDANDIRQMSLQNSALKELLDPRLPYTRAEIEWICKNEMVVNLEDVLARRTRALFLDARASGDIAPEVAHIMASINGKDTEWEKAQTESYRKLILNYIN